MPAKADQNIDDSNDAAAEAAIITAFGPERKQNEKNRFAPTKKDVLRLYKVQKKPLILLNKRLFVLLGSFEHFQ